jgi:hypothetical protein
MAIVKEIDIKVNAKEGVKSLEQINTIIKEQKTIQLELQRELLNTEKLLKDTPKNALSAQKELKDRVIQLKDALKDQSLSLKELNDQKSNSVKADKKQESSSKGVAKGFNLVGTAMKATGIGLIVALVAKLTQSLSENQKVVDFVSTAFTTVSIITNELINKFTEIFSKISQATGGFDALGKVVGALVKVSFNTLKIIVLELQGGFTALKLAYETIFGDSKGVEKAKKDLIEIGKKLKETGDDQVKQGKKIFDNVGEAFNEVVTGVTILATEGVKAISEVDLKSSFAQAQAITRNKQNFELLALQQARLQLSFQNQAELQRQIRDDDTKGLAERQKANDKLGAILDKQFNAEKATISARISGLQNEQSLLGSTNERYNEIFQLQTDLIDVEERLNGQRSEQLTNTNTLLKEQKDLIQSQVDTQNEFAISQKEFEAEQAETELLKIERQREAIQLQIEIDNAELERKRLLYAADTQARTDAENEFILAKQVTDQALLSNTKQTADETTRIAKENADKQIENEKLFAALQKGIQDQRIENISSGIALLGQLAGKNKTLQKAAIIAESALGIGKSVIATSSSNIAAVAAGAALAIPTSGASVAAASALVAANNIGLGIGIASNVAATAKALSALGGGGGGASGGATPSGGGAAAPSFNLVQGTGSNQIAQSLTNETRPIQAFVVASSVTSQQELDRNANNEGTIG